MVARVTALEATFHTLAIQNRRITNFLFLSSVLFRLLHLISFSVFFVCCWNSFSVPANLSSLGKDEPWAETFLLHMLQKVDRCKDVWKSIKLEVTRCAPKSIAL